MLIECGTCRVRACGDCVIPALLRVDPPGAGSPAGASGGPVRGVWPGCEPVPPPPDLVVWLDDGELAALGLLAEWGMVPPLRHERAS